MYLNVYVPHLQSVGAVVGYLRVHRGQRFASTTAVTPMTEAFVRNIDQFINHEGVDLVAFQKWQRKDDVTQKYLRRFTQCEGVLYSRKRGSPVRQRRLRRRSLRSPLRKPPARWPMPRPGGRRRSMRSGPESSPSRPAGTAPGARRTRPGREPMPEYGQNTAFRRSPAICAAALRRDS